MASYIESSFLTSPHQYSASSTYRSTKRFLCAKQSLISALMTLSVTLLVGTLLYPQITLATPHQHNAMPTLPNSITLPAKQKNLGQPEFFSRGKILLQPRAGLPFKALDNLVKVHGGKARKIGQSNLYIVDLPEYAEEGIVVRLQNHPYLKFVELDKKYSSSLIPNDEYFGWAWHHSQIGTPAAWDISQGNGITIAVLDSGVFSAHPDLATNIVSGWNFYDGNSNTQDILGHGTAVAGSIAAITDNRIGVSAIAGQANIMPLRVTDTNGYGYGSAITQALVYASDNGARLANISFENLSSSSSIRTAAQYMKDNNGLVVVSAGNTGAYENFTSTSSMIPISATDQYDMIANFSSYGNYVALAAPGTSIMTTIGENVYGPSSGTSIASPLVAGVASLMMSANPTLSNLEIENLLYSTAVDLGDPGRDPYFGYGRVDAAAAVQAAIDAVPAIDTEAPTATIAEPLDGATVTGIVPVDVDATDNMGLSRAELWINDTVVAIDTSMPFAFAWDSTGVPNGMTNLTAHVFDAAGNRASSIVAVNVDNHTEPPPPVTDTEAPIVQLINPVAGNVSGNVTISADANDNYGANGITLSLYIDASLVATGTGSTMAYSWNTRPKKIYGTYTIKAVAQDAAGNTSSTSVNVNVIK